MDFLTPIISVGILFCLAAKTTLVVNLPRPRLCSLSLDARYNNRGITFRPWNGFWLTVLLNLPKNVENGPFFLRGSRWVPRPCLFLSGNILYFLLHKISFWGEVLSTQIENLRKKSGEPLYCRTRPWQPPSFHQNLFLGGVWSSSSCREPKKNNGWSTSTFACVDYNI